MVELFLIYFRKADIDQYISESLRRQCYNEWVQVRRCAVKNLGESFAVKLNLARMVDNSDVEEFEAANYYENLITQQKTAFKFEKNQGGFPDEEEAVEEESEEAGEEASEESAAASDEE